MLNFGRKFPGEGEDSQSKEKILFSSFKREKRSKVMYFFWCSILNLPKTRVGQKSKKHQKFATTFVTKSLRTMSQVFSGNLVMVFRNSP